MQTLCCVSSVHNCHEFSQLPSCIDEAISTRKKSSIAYTSWQCRHIILGASASFVSLLRSPSWRLRGVKTDPKRENDLGGGGANNPCSLPSLPQPILLSSLRNACRLRTYRQHPCKNVSHEDSRELQINQYLVNFHKALYCLLLFFFMVAKNLTCFIFRLCPLGTSRTA